MLKKIPVEELQSGMYLHELCGSWADHPFWRTRFLLRDSAIIRKIVESGIREVWIDTERGLDVEAGRSESQVLEEVERELLEASTAPMPLGDPPRSRERELSMARKVIGHSRQKVQSLLSEARLGRAVDAEQGREVVSEIAESVAANPGTLVSLARLKNQDDYTYLHSVAVCALMVALSRQLQLPEPMVREAGLAGLMHDLGKALMPPEILGKPGRLTDAEFAVMRSHPERGHALLVEGGTASAEVLDVCLHHHEKVDGSGYPHRLKEDGISLLARMGAVCDVYDAITSNRPYKAGWDPGESLRQMAQWKSHFDQRIFQAFVRTVGIYPTGTLVRLASGRLAVVAQQNTQSLLVPLVKVFFSTKSDQRIPPEDLDLSLPGCRDRIEAVESPEKWGFRNLELLWTEGVGV